MPCGVGGRRAGAGADADADAGADCGRGGEDGGSGGVKGWTTAALSPRQCRHCCRLQSAAAEAAAPLLSPAPLP